MNITLSITKKLVKEVRKIAAELDTTLTGLVRACVECLFAGSAVSGRKRREREALERSLERFHFQVGERTRKREGLHARS
jgi:hypothetical protein